MREPGSLCRSERQEYLHLFFLQHHLLGLMWPVQSQRELGREDERFKAYAEHKTGRGGAIQEGSEK